MIKLEQKIAFFLMIGIAIFSVFFALSFGAADITFADVLLTATHDVENDKQLAFVDRIIWELRFPRTLLALLAGMGLSMSGLILQTVTRNPLADPYLFGISSGASFGVVVLVTLVGTSHGFALSGAAFLGSLLAMLLLLLIAGAKKVAQVESMLLAGVVLSFLFSSFTSLMLYMSDPQAVTAILFWTLGSFARANWDNLLMPCVIVSCCIVFMLSYRRQLNAMLLGDESATTLGVNVKRFRIIMLVLSSLITAILVSVCGGISFVGLIIPHIVRFFVSQGSSFGVLLTALIGGVFMVWVDVLSRIVLTNQELPIGVITALSGSLFFLSLLYLRKYKTV